MNAIELAHYHINGEAQCGGAFRGCDACMLAKKVLQLKARNKLTQKWLDNFQGAVAKESLRALTAENEVTRLRAENVELREMYRNTERDLQAQNRATEAFERQAEEAERENAELRELVKQLVQTRSDTTLAFVMSDVRKWAREHGVDE